MEPSDVHRILTGKGVRQLYHANTIETSCTFLEQGALLSRGYVENHGLRQTAQRSDDIDKRYLIWDRIFLDHIDIHERGGRVRGPNRYGPVLFVLSLDMLLQLPVGSEVSVTKSNPTHWFDGQATAERWFESPDELNQLLNFGDFDKMLVVSTGTEKIDFPHRRVDILLDDPQRRTSMAVDAFVHARERLAEAAQRGGVDASIFSRVCTDQCVCVQKYSDYESQYLDSRFVRA